MKSFQDALFLVLSGRATVDGVIESFNLSRTKFKRFLFSRGYNKILEMPIILFDLNGTLCNRTDRNRVINLRPHITELKKLKKRYRLGVYTSCTRYNALLICEEIENACGKLFDRHLIFTREHTMPFTEEEFIELELPPFKMKKSISQLFTPENIDNITVVDDELVRVVEKDKAIGIKSWYGDQTDDSLKHLVTKLCAMNVTPHHQIIKEM